MTQTSDITTGQYLIVYETGNVAFNGALETLDATENTVAVTISDGKIASSEDIDAAVFTINVTDGTLKSASGNYIGVSSNSNGLKQTEEASTYTHTFSIDDDGNAVITAVFDASTMSLRFNAASNQNRFRYYKNSDQQAIQLYKYTEASAQGGSDPQQPAASGSKVTLNDGGVDADKWTLKAGEQEAKGSVDLTDVAEGTEVVATYSGSTCQWYTADGGTCVSQTVLLPPPLLTITVLPVPIR